MIGTFHRGRDLKSLPTTAVERVKPAVLTIFNKATLTARARRMKVTLARSDGAPSTFRSRTG